MRCCLVSYEYPPETAKGGIGTQTWNKAQGLAKLGHSVEVLTCSGTAITEPVRSNVESGTVVHRMRRPGGATAIPISLHNQATFMLGYMWCVLDNLTQLVAKEPFDLINFPEYGAEGLAFQTNRTRYNWVPVIVQLHAPLAMLAERMGWPEKESTFYRTAAFMEGESIRLADGWMASSANIADFVAEFYQIRRDEIDVVHCGVDCGMFRPLQEVNENKRRPKILFVGDISLSKGIGTVFEATVRLTNRYPELLLQVVGKENEVQRRLRSQAKSMGIENHFEWIPYVKDRETIVGFYQQADVFASPADHENGVANVYVEAMACGCPVVAANTGGAPEAVMDGLTGLLVPPRDVDAVVSAVDRILADGPLRGRMRFAARQRALDYFAQEQYIKRVVSAYEKTIGRSQRKLRQLTQE